ncbi:hypothetical protein Hanom_Chr02g00128771 [Helianthus anomalus]
MLFVEMLVKDKVDFDEDYLACSFCISYFVSNRCKTKTSIVMKFYFYTCLYVLQYSGYALPISNAYA